MTLSEALGDFLTRRKKCEKLVNYENRVFKFKGISVEFSEFQANVGSFFTEKKVLHKAYEGAKALDDFQYYLCSTTKSIPEKERRRYVEMRVAAIALLTAFRITLEAYKEDPKGQRDNLDRIVKTIHEYVNSFSTEGLIISEKKESSAVTNALEVSGLNKGETDGLVDRETRKAITFLGEQQKIVVEKLNEFQETFSGVVGEIKKTMNQFATLQLESDLRIVDIWINERLDSDDFPQLDVKLRNIGGQVAFLKRIDFHVDKVWTIRHPATFSATPISCDYHVLLPIKESSYIKSVEVSQAIESNSVDRFSITIANDELADAVLYIYRLRLTLVYNENDGKTESDWLFVTSHRPAEIGGIFSFGNMPEFAQQNNKVVNEIADLGGKKTETLERILQKFRPR